MVVARTLIFFVAASVIFAAPTGAQTPAPQPLPSLSAASTFDVISIKAAKPGATGSHSHFNNALYTAGNVTLSEIIQFNAYGVPASRIIGIPPELDKVAFDIQAKVDPSEFARIQALPDNQRTEQSQQLIRQLLADRFKLVLHTETRELPVYALVVTKGSSKLQPAKDPDRDSTSSSTGQLKAEGANMARLANSLTRISSAELGRIVIDKTGLTGKYDFTLKWTPDSGSPPMVNGEPDTSAPSIFTAIQEQLGLKLESTKAPVSVLVIDHAELPTEN